MLSYRPVFDLKLLIQLMVGYFVCVSVVYWSRPALLPLGSALAFLLLSSVFLGFRWRDRKRMRDLQMGALETVYSSNVHRFQTFEAFVDYWNGYILNEEWREKALNTIKEAKWACTWDNHLQPARYRWSMHFKRLNGWENQESDAALLIFFNIGCINEFSYSFEVSKKGIALIAPSLISTTQPTSLQAVHQNSLTFWSAFQKRLGLFTGRRIQFREPIFDIGIGDRIPWVLPQSFKLVDGSILDFKLGDEKKVVVSYRERDGRYEYPSIDEAWLVWRNAIADIYRPMDPEEFVEHSVKKLENSFQKAFAKNTYWS